MPDMTRPSQVSPPDVALSDLAPTRVVGAEVIALPVLPGDEGVALGPGTAELLDELDLDLFALLQHHKANGKAGEVTEHVVLDATGLSNDGLRSVMLVGVGRADADDLRKAGAALARRTKGRSTVATTLAALADDSGLRALVEGLVLGSFGFHRKSSEPSTLPVGRVVLAGLADPAARKPALERAMAVAGAAWLSRTLALVPSNEKSPAWLANRATEIAESAGLKVDVWDEHRLRDEGFGGIVGVGQGSGSPPRLIRLDYAPRRASRRTKHIVLVGKGITFDTGGYSIKPGDAMMNMKRDMTGAGVVLAVMGALAALECPVRVTGLLACAENAVSGSAIRPGDVLRHYGGRTTEVTNTDAEGRLVMADALAYAVREIKPDALVDVATLTGSIKVSLGQRTAGYFATDDTLGELVETAGRAAGEPFWRMPLHDDYVDRLESKVADADNAPGGPGAVMAALFLQPFTAGLPWAHLDIASVGDSPVDAFEYTSGATGFGARTLLHWLELREPLAGVGS
jgi:leucyl aminopeptidase